MFQLALEEYVNNTPPLINIILNEIVSPSLLTSLKDKEGEEEIDRCWQLINLFKVSKEMMGCVQTEEVMMLWRGINFDLEDEPINIPHKGLISTTSDMKYASLYSGNFSEMGPIILKIQVPIGVPMIIPGEFDIYIPDQLGDEFIQFF